MTETCRTCRYYLAGAGTGVGVQVGEETGQCRAEVPVPVPVLNRSAWPVVRPEDWCGRFRAAEGGAG
jgi:hypothetical protein